MSTNTHVMLGHVLVGGLQKRLRQFDQLYPSAKRHKNDHRTRMVLNSLHDHGIPFPVIETPNFSLPLENHASSQRTNFEV